MLRSRMVMLAAFLAGVLVGWLVKPETTAAALSLGNVAERNMPTRTVSNASTQAKVTKKWMDRLETSDIREVALEIPSGDFEPLIEGLMVSVWGGMSSEQLDLFMVLLGSWSDQDLEGALAWARALQNPKQREVGLIGIAARVGKEDPEAAFEIYTGLEEVTTESGHHLSMTMRTLYDEAAKQGVEAVLDLARRTPKNGTGSIYGIPIDYPDDFNFQLLMDGLAKITDPGGSGGVEKPFAPAHPLGSWAVRDSEAAFDYVVDTTSKGQFLRWNDMAHELGKKWGTVEAESWMGKKLAELSSAEQRALLGSSDLTHSPGNLRKYISNMPTEEAATEFRFQYMDYTKKHLQLSLQVLNDVPEVEDRVEIIERLRGVADDQALRRYLLGLNLDGSRIDEIVDTVGQPEKDDGGKD